MNYDDHCINLGRLWSNLQSLEVTLRLFLTQANSSENHITNRDTFGTLVGKYNGQLSKDEQSLYSVDTSVVDTRNALAHGLVSSGSVERFPRTLSHNDQEVEMTVDWFDAQVTLAQEQIGRVSACGKSRWQSPWWG
jgi:hypothetical protein